MLRWEDRITLQVLAKLFRGRRILRPILKSEYGRSLHAVIVT